jgi:hypothetical protein
VKKSSLTIVGDRLPGKVVRPRTYKFSKWERLFFDIDSIRQHEIVVIADISSRRIEPPEVKGLATRFASLKNLKDINRFAGECGLLGLSIEPDNLYDPPAYGEAWFEPLSAWQHHIEIVRRLMLLYQALSRWKKGYDIEIEDRLLKVESIAPFENLLWLEWYDGKLTGIQLGDINAYLPAVFGTAFVDTINLEHLDEYTLAVLVLTVYLRHNLQGGVNLDFSKIIPARDAAIGFRIEEKRSTPYVLAAIYYDLWELITDNRPAIRCRFCGLPLEKAGRREYCNDACKQAAYRKRKAKVKK